jgi:hypothetical protein
MADAEVKKYEHGSGPRHYYKSGWCTKHGHGHFGGKVGPLTSLKSNKRWLQLRHYVIYYYEKEQSSYNSWVSPSPHPSPLPPPRPHHPRSSIFLCLSNFTFLIQYTIVSKTDTMPIFLSPLIGMA